MTLERRLYAGALIATLAVGATTALSWLLPAAGPLPFSGTLALATCHLTETGSARLVPLVLLLAVVLWVTDPGAVWARRRREVGSMLLIMVVALPTLAALNEFVVKPEIRVPRPSHLRMVEARLIPEPPSFAQLDMLGRRAFLESRLPGASLHAAAESLQIHPAVLEHWIHETGYTFPSGHAFNSFIAAVLCLGVALANPTRRRRRLAGGMLAWAVAVSMSRVALLLHRPVDVFAGALAGTVCGTVLVLLWWRWTQPRAHSGS